MSNTIKLKRFDGASLGNPPFIFENAELVWDYTRKSLRIGDGINTWEDLIEFPTQSVTSFLALTDTPATYGIPGQVPVINEAGTGLEFATVASSYELPIASADVLGGVKIGDNLSIDGSGVLSAVASPYELPTASADTLGGVKVGSRLTITDGVLSADEQGGGLVKVSSNDTTAGYLLGKIVAGAGINVTVQNAEGNETLELSAPVAVYSDGDANVTLPENPIKGQIFEYVGTGTIWLITANTGQQIRYLSETGNTITAGHGYACCMLIFLDDANKTWLVKNVTGLIDITTEGP